MVNNDNNKYEQPNAITNYHLGIVEIMTNGDFLDCLWLGFPHQIFQLTY